MSKTIFEVSDLSVSFGDNKAIDNLSFDIQKGEVLGVVGESGSGKTTLGRVLAGLLEPTAGNVLYRATPQDALLDNLQTLQKRKGSAKYKSYRKNVQMIFQDPFSSLDPKMKVGQIIAEGLDNLKLYNSKIERQNKIENLLENVGLEKDMVNRFIHEFSGGQRQRIGIARAISIEPELLICDEPISSLDVSVGAQIVNLLVELNQTKNITLLFISHDIGIVEYISNRILVMSNGEIVEQGDASKVLNNPQHPYTQELIASVPKINEGNI